MNLSEIVELFDYTEWANHLALDAAGGLSAEDLNRDVGISHKSILGTLAHMAGAERIWLSRWKGESPGGIWGPGDFDDVLSLRERWSELELERREFISGLDDEAIARALAYRNMKGEPHTLPLVRQMQHVVNHSTLHRGQVIGMIRQLGIAPPAVDLIFYLLR